MYIKYISLGSFCHPKIYIRKTKRNISESLPFDFHSTPNTYSIYSILNKLFNQKTFSHEFKEILFEHEYNDTKKKELAVSDNEGIFFLHFFDLDDKLSDNIEYPINIQDNLNNDKIIEVNNKFKKRYEKLYNILNNKNDILVFLRIENYINKSWEVELPSLINSLKQYKNQNKFLIYTQIEISDHLDFNDHPEINYSYGFPILFYKFQFDEKITSNKLYEEKFEKIFTNFENIISNSIYLNFNKNTSVFYHDKNNNLLFNLNNINEKLNIKSMNNLKLDVYYNNKLIVFFKNTENIYESIC